jgi:hypothetical protein
MTDSPWARQNPAFTEGVHCWENQHFRDRWRSLLSVDDLVQMVVDEFTTAGKIDDTYIFYSSDHGYKQGQWRVGTSKQHPYDTDIRVPLLARGPGIKPGTIYNEVSGNVDLTPTLLYLAGGAAYAPEFMDGKNMMAFLAPSLEPKKKNDAATVPWRTKFINEYKSVGTYFNDHSSCWGNDVIDGKQCPGKMPRGPDPEGSGGEIDYSKIRGPVVIEGENQTIFLDNGNGEYDAEGNLLTTAEAGGSKAGCVESTGIGDGTCYFVDSTHSNNWRQLRIINATMDMNYIEYDPNWAFNDTAAMQHYELYDVAKDKYQMHNIYPVASAEVKAALHAELDEYWHCGSPVNGAIGVGILPSGKSNCP